MSYPVHLLEVLTWSPSGEPEGLGTRINVVLLVGGVILFFVGGSQSSSSPEGAPPEGGDDDPDDWWTRWTRWKWWLVGAAVGVIVVGVALLPEPPPPPAGEVVRFVPGETFFGWVTPEVITPAVENLLTSVPGDLPGWVEYSLQGLSTRVDNLTPVEAWAYAYDGGVQLFPPQVELLLDKLPTWRAEVFETLGVAARVEEILRRGNPEVWPELSDRTVELLLEEVVSTLAQRVLDEC